MTDVRLLNAKHVAELLDMTVSAVYSAAERGEIPGLVRIGARRIRFRSDAIAELIRRGSPRGSVPPGRAPAKP